MKKNLILTLLLATPFFCYGKDGCEQHTTKTAYGSLTEESCGSRDTVPLPNSTATTYSYRYIYTLKLDGVPILRDSVLSLSDFDAGKDKSRPRWIYSGSPKPETGCNDRLYLVDLSMKPVKIITFGVKKACNEFYWASWGEKRSVIALKNNVKFIYENGKMMLPAKGEQLWKSIEPPHAGAGLDLEDAVAFAEDVQPPK
jgi:hypothetical protein